MAENYEITRETVHKLLPRRSPYIHKGDCGRVLILAGASGMAGAAVLSVRASMRSGAGLTYICTTGWPTNWQEEEMSPGTMM